MLGFRCVNIGKRWVNNNFTPYPKIRRCINSVYVHLHTTTSLAVSSQATVPVGDPALVKNPNKS